MHNRRPWRPADGDEICQNCGGANPPWWIDSDIWNVVVDPREKILCPNCFMHLASDRGFGGVWRVHAD